MRAAITTFCLLSAIDLVATLLLVNKWGPYAECNPIARAIFMQAGPGWFGAAKFLGVVVWVILVKHLPEYWRARILDVSNGMMLAVVAQHCLNL